VQAGHLRRDVRAGRLIVDGIVTDPMVDTRTYLPVVQRCVMPYCSRILGPFDVWLVRTPKGDHTHLTAPLCRECAAYLCAHQRQRG
jgi:hypothetical protein